MIADPSASAPTHTPMQTDDTASGATLDVAPHHGGTAGPDGDASGTRAATPDADGSAMPAATPDDATVATADACGALDRRVVTLDVGGRTFRTTVGTLCAGSGYFRSQFARFPPATGDDGRVSLFIDRDPQAFEHVLALLRDPAYAVPRAYRRELLFYAVGDDDDAAAGAYDGDGSAAVELRGMRWLEAGPLGGAGVTAWTVALPPDVDAGAHHAVVNIALCGARASQLAWDDIDKNDDSGTGGFEHHGCDVGRSGSVKRERPGACGWRIDTVEACRTVHQCVTQLVDRTLDVRAASGMFANRRARMLTRPWAVAVCRGDAVLATWHTDCLWMVEQSAGEPRLDGAVDLRHVLPPLPCAPDDAAPLRVTRDKRGSRKQLRAELLSAAPSPWAALCDPGETIAVPTCLCVLLEPGAQSVPLDLPPGQAVTHVLLRAFDRHNPVASWKLDVATRVGIVSDGRTVAQQGCAHTVRYTAYANAYHVLAVCEGPPSPEPARVLRLGAKSELFVRRDRSDRDAAVRAHVVYMRRVNPRDGSSWTW